MDYAYRGGFHHVSREIRATKWRTAGLLWEPGKEPPMMPKNSVANRIDPKPVLNLEVRRVRMGLRTKVTTGAVSSETVRPTTTEALPRLRVVR